ncbi:hypothetical protein Vpro01_02301 [Vibrio proteolyticus]
MITSSSARSISSRPSALSSPLTLMPLELESISSRSASSSPSSPMPANGSSPSSPSRLKSSSLSFRSAKISSLSAATASSELSSNSCSSSSSALPNKSSSNNNSSVKSSSSSCSDIAGGGVTGITGSVTGGCTSVCCVGSDLRRPSSIVTNRAISSPGITASAPTNQVLDINLSSGPGASWASLALRARSSASRRSTSSRIRDSSLSSFFSTLTSD